MKQPSPFQLGATLYTPATRTDLSEIILANKIPDLRSLVICLEDAVRPDEMAQALHNLRTCLQQLTQAPVKQTRPLVFARPRNPKAAWALLDMAGIEHLQGWVLPKFDQHSLAAWEEVLAAAPAHFVCMPTLETHAMFDPYAVCDLRRRLQDSHLASRVLALRIGGNDLLSCLHLRRQPQQSLYDGPLAYTISMLVSQFAPYGFRLTAPVFEYFRDLQGLQQEFERDLAYGLVGKTAIHPAQLATIHTALRVRPNDYDMACQILDASQPAVFQYDGAMCEPSTHRNWAWQVLERARHFGQTSQHKTLQVTAALNTHKRMA